MVQFLSLERRPYAMLKAMQWQMSTDYGEVTSIPALNATVVKQLRSY